MYSPADGVSWTHAISELATRKLEQGGVVDLTSPYFLLSRLYRKLEEAEWVIIDNHFEGKTM